MAYKYGVVKNGIVVNIIMWDKVSPWELPEGYTMVRHNTIDVGDRWDFELEEVVRICRTYGCAHSSHSIPERVHPSYRLAKYTGE